MRPCGLAAAQACVDRLVEILKSEGLVGVRERDAARIRRI
jgi:hypothetical protein